ncbi:hypothetical protein N7523_009383 [Penicillium sp. IBT 18751x]|nr:hypothetical protein N7523_009383 [Penicillium sp. IBT 18751x]
MTQKNTPNPKTLGRSAGSINAPIAAFTMAVILCTYCFSSIRTARREAQDKSPTEPISQRLSRQERKDSSPTWIQQAIEESHADAGKQGKSG